MRDFFLCDEYEMYRFANKLNTNVQGGFSKLLKYFIKKRFSHNSKDKFEEDQVIKKTYCIFDYANRLPIKN